jgi:exopolysaccharide production protein ExoQ
MSFPIALLLSLSFSAFFIYRDRHQAAEVSAATWIPTIWFTLAIAKPLSYWISPSSFWSGQSGLDTGMGSPVDRAVLTFLMAIALLELLRRRLDWTALLRRNGIFLLVFAYLALSILWSAYQPIATKRFFRGLGDIMMALIIISDPSPFGATKVMIKRAAFVLLPLSIVLIKYFRTLGVAYDWDGTEMWVGVTLQKNSLGILACISAAYFIMELVTTWRKKIPRLERITQLLFLLLALYLLVKSSSATSLGAFLFGVAVYVLSFMQRGNSRSIGRLYIVILVIGVLLFATKLEFLVAAMGRNMTFTSRSFIWEKLMEVGMRHPVLGVGYGSLWIGQLGNELWNDFRVNEAHNGYIEIFVLFGVVGLFLTAVMIVQVFRHTMKTMDLNFKYGIFRIAFLVMILISNVTESSLLITMNKLWILFLVVGMQPLDSSFGYQTAPGVRGTTEIPGEPVFEKNRLGEDRG